MKQIIASVFFDILSYTIGNIFFFFLYSFILYNYIQVKVSSRTGVGGRGCEVLLLAMVATWAVVSLLSLSVRRNVRSTLAA